MVDIIILAIYGIVAGILAGIFGIGGGTIIVPAMMFFGFDIKNAIGISVMQMVFSSIYGSYLNIRSKILDINKGIIIGLGGLCGAAFSGIIVKSVSAIWLECVFLAVCFYSFYKVLKKSPIVASKPKGNVNFILFITGFVTGIFAISLGIGGGLIIVPIVSYYLGIPTKKVVPISLFFVIFSSISGFASLALNGLVNYKEGLIVGIFSLIGVTIGTKLMGRIPQRKHKIAVIILYVLVLGVMIKNIFLG